MGVCCVAEGRHSQGRASQHQVEPDPAEIVASHGAETPSLDCRTARVLVVLRPGRRHGADRDEEASGAPIERSPFRSQASLALASAIVCHGRDALLLGSVLRHARGPRGLA